jgi:hypothetical protein
MHSPQLAAAGGPPLLPIGDRFSPLSPEEVARIEQAIRKPLPLDYAHHLLTIGACRFNGEAYVRVGDATLLPLFTLFGSDCDHQGILGVLAFHDDLRNAGLVPIGDDLYSNLYILDPSNGSVSFVTFDHGVATATKVATSFTGFMKVVHVEPV